MLEKEVRLQHYKNVLKIYKSEYFRRISFILRILKKEVKFKNYPQYYEGLCHALLREFRTVNTVKFVNLKEVLDMYVELKEISMERGIYTICGRFYYKDDLKSRIKLLEEVIKRMEL